MNDIISRIFAGAALVKKPQRKFMVCFLNVLMCVVGRANYLNLSRYSELSERSFRRWSTREFDYLAGNCALLESSLGKRSYVGAIDASFLKKSGRHTEGLGRYWNGSASRVEQGLEVSTVAVIDLEDNTGYALESRLTTDGDEEDRVSQYIKQIEDCSDWLKNLGVKYLCTDGYYTKKTLLTAIRSSGLWVIGKLRHDAHLRWVYEGDYAGRGRPKKYGAKVDTKGCVDDWHYVGTTDDGIELYEAVVWIPGLSKKEKFKVVRAQRFVDEKLWQVLLYSSDTELCGHTLFTHYKSRFQIEFIFRDAKQHTGLGHCQGRSLKAQNNCANASLMALNIMKIEDRQLQVHFGPKVISIESVKRRKHNQHFMHILFDALDLKPNCRKVQEVYQRFSDFGCIAA